MIAGDVTYETEDVGEALDQLAREILRHLGQHKLTVVWLFDESGSMKDDQQAIREKFDRVATELKVNVDDDPRRAAGALNHAIVGFGDEHPLRAGEADRRHRRDRQGDRPAAGRRDGGREHDARDRRT